MPRIGLSNLYYAIMTSDTPGGTTTYQAPVALPNITSADVKNKSQFAVFYADDKASATASTTSEITFDFEVGDLPLETQAALLGHTVVNGTLVVKSSDVAPYVAIGFMSLKENGKYRYVWLYKGKFSVPDESYKTKGDKIDFQTSKISGTFIPRASDSAFRKIADADSPTFTDSVGTNWFTVVDGVADTVPPAITAVAPANNANAVANNSVVSWTFSEPIQNSTVVPANFLVQKADGSGVVAGVLSLDPTNKIVTFTPSAALAAATQYMALVTQGVKDMAGNSMVAPSVTKFTTA